MKFSSEFASKDVPTLLPNSAKVVQKNLNLFVLFLVSKFLSILFQEFSRRGD